MTDEARMADDGSCVQEPQRDPVWQAIIDRVWTEGEWVDGHGNPSSDPPFAKDRRDAIWYWWNFRNHNEIPGLQDEVRKYGPWGKP